VEANNTEATKRKQKKPKREEEAENTKAARRKRKNRSSETGAGKRGKEEADGRLAGLPAGLF
jgi:hypothetical protein